MTVMITEGPAPDPAAEDLRRLAAKGLKDVLLEQCGALFEVVCQELGIEPLEGGVRTQLLRAVITNTVAETRAQALTALKKRPEDGQPAAAAGELLAIPYRENDETFETLLRDVRGVSAADWSLWIGKNPGKKGRQLRANIWLNHLPKYAYKAAEKRQDEILAALLAAIKSHLTRNRTGIRAGLEKGNWPLKEDQPTQPDLAVIAQSSALKAPSASLRKLLSFARSYSEDLDIATERHAGSDPFDADTSRPRTLSTGLYVRRTLQDMVMRHLLVTRESEVPDKDNPVLIKGQAGYGKSCFMWAIHRDLGEADAVQPLLINATWLVPDASGSVAITPDDIIAAAAEVQAAGTLPVVLIDTADLLLHQQIDIYQLVALCRALRDQQVRVVLTCRPEESAALDSLKPRRYELLYYNDEELPSAVEKHAAMFCPDAEPRDPAERIRLVTEPVARGLPLREVCRSPLLLRLLFELNPHPNTFPELREVDVSKIYEALWERRVVSDRRLEQGHGVTSAEDLSEVAGGLAVALLALGRIAHDRMKLIDLVVRSGAAGNRSAVAQGVEQLVRRGILQGSGDGTLRFFHQTVFEYAAARGLIARFGSQAADKLVPTLVAQPQELFIGAVLEQLLILAGSDPFAQEDVGAAVKTLAETKHPTLHRIAIAAVAHHPRLGKIAPSLFDEGADETIKRFAHIAPSVATLDLPQLGDQFGRLWERSPCHLSVLEALERISAREPSWVLALLRSWTCVDVVLGKSDRMTYRVLPRILGAVAHIDPEYSRSALTRLFTESELPSHSGRQGTSQRQFQMTVLEACAAYSDWIVTGTFIEGLVPSFRDFQTGRNRESKRMHEALGAMYGVLWVGSFAEEFSKKEHAAEGCDGCWLTLVGDLRDQIMQAEADPVHNARLVGVALVLAGLPAGHWAPTKSIDALLKMKDTYVGPFALPRSFFPTLLASDSHAGQIVEQRLAGMLDHLPAPGNKPPLGDKLWAAVAREALAVSQQPADRIARILRLTTVGGDEELWFQKDGMATLLVPSALGGHEIAVGALERLSHEPDVLDAAASSLIRRALAEAIEDHPVYIRLLADLSVAAQRATPLNDVMKEHGLGLKPYLESRATALWGLGEALLASANGTDHQEALALWRQLDAIGLTPVVTMDDLRQRFHSTTDHRTRGSILEFSGDLAQHGMIPLDEADGLLSEHFTVSDDDPPRLSAVVRVRNYPNKQAAGLSQEAADNAKRARDALVLLLCRRGPIDAESRERYLHLSSALPTDGRVLGAHRYVIERLIDQADPQAAAEHLLLLMESVKSIIGIQQKSQDGKSLSEDNLANNLRSAMSKLFRANVSAVNAQLIGEVPTMPPTHALVLVSSAANAAYDSTYDLLSTLLDGRPLPRGVAGQIDGDRRLRRRVASTVRLPDLLR